MKKLPAGEQRELVVTFCCNKKEYDAIQKKVQGTTCRSMSEYARRMLLRKPISVIHRNASLDDLIESVNALRRELGKHSEYVGVAQVLVELKPLFHKISEQCMQNGM